MGKRVTAVAVFVAAAFAFAVAGLAYFTTIGSGHGYVSVANTQNLTVSSALHSGALGGASAASDVGAGSSALYPGGSADLTAIVHNPNPDPVRIHSFVLDLGRPSEGITNDRSGCTSGGNTGSSTNSVTFNGPVLNGATDFDFLPGNTTVTLHNALSMSTSAENACQGATFTVYLQAASS